MVEAIRRIGVGPRRQVPTQTDQSRENRGRPIPSLGARAFGQISASPGFVLPLGRGVVGSRQTRSRRGSRATWLGLGRLSFDAAARMRGGSVAAVGGGRERSPCEASSAPPSAPASWRGPRWSRRVGEVAVHQPRERAGIGAARLPFSLALTTKPRRSLPAEGVGPPPGDRSRQGVRIAARLWRGTPLLRLCARPPGLGIEPQRSGGERSPQQPPHPRLFEFCDGLRRLRGNPRRSDIVSVDLMVRSIQKRIVGMEGMLRTVVESQPIRAYC